MWTTKVALRSLERCLDDGEAQTAAQGTPVPAAEKPVGNEIDLVLRDPRALILYSNRWRARGTVDELPHEATIWRVLHCVLIQVLLREMEELTAYPNSHVVELLIDRHPDSALTRIEAG